MLPTKETQHVETARTLLIEQFKNRRVIEGFLDCLSRQVQDIEGVLWDVIDSRLLATATNAQLDTLGRLAKERRLGRNDDDFRAAIRLRIRVNRLKGRIFDIVDVAMLADLTGTPRVTEYRYLGFEVEIYNQPGERYVAFLLNLTRSATSYGLLTASDLPLDDLLAFDDNVESDPFIETFSDSVSGTSKVSASGYGLPSDFLGTAVDGAYSLYGTGPFGAFGFGS